MARHNPRGPIQGPALRQERYQNFEFGLHVESRADLALHGGTHGDILDQDWALSEAHLWVRDLILIEHDITTVLDLGCARGKLGEELLEAGVPRVIGVDIREDALEIGWNRLQRRFPGRFWPLCVDLISEKVDVPAQVDAATFVLSLHLVEHFAFLGGIPTAVDNLLRQTKSIVRPGGVVVVVELHDQGFPPDHPRAPIDRGAPLDHHVMESMLARRTEIGKYCRQSESWWLDILGKYFGAPISYASDLQMSDETQKRLFGVAYRV